MLPSPSPSNPSLPSLVKGPQHKIFAADPSALYKAGSIPILLHNTALVVPLWPEQKNATAQPSTLASYRTMTFDQLEASAETDWAPAPPTKNVRSVPVKQPLPGSGPWMPGQLVIQTTHVDFYIGRSSFSAATAEWIALEAERSLAEAEARLGSGLISRTSLAFYRPALASIPGIRGMAFTRQRKLEVYYGSWEDPERAVAIVVHELAHQLEADRYGNAVQSRADTILHEGLATWLAGKRWLAMRGADSWRERGRQLQQSGRLLSLYRDPSGELSNDAYDGWASFVDYLIRTYGWAAFDDLYRSSRGRSPGSANYSLVYGRSLDQLAEDWRAWLSE